MNKREKSLLTELYWVTEKHKNDYALVYHIKNILGAVLREEYGIAEKLLLRKTIEQDIENPILGMLPDLEGVALPDTPTPTKCPKCGETEHYRTIYTDDEMTEVDFYDCMICRCHWKPEDIIGKPNSPNLDLKIDHDCLPRTITKEEQRKDELSEWIVSGLITDGAHHKQWYLEKVLEELMGEDYVKTMRDENESWEKGIPP